jgi:ketosteroid isomerase-like protein
LSAETLELVRRALEAFERGDMDEALVAAHPDLVTRRVDPDDAVFHGPEGMIQALAEWTEDFSDWSQTTQEVVEAGDTVVARVHQTARGAASGIAVEADFWIVFTPDGDKIREVAIYSDRDRAFGD